MLCLGEHQHISKPALILLQVQCKEGSPKNSNPINTFIHSFTNSLWKKARPVWTSKMWKVNFTMGTVFTLGQDTSIGTLRPGRDLGVSQDSETWGHFSKEPPPFLPAPPPQPLKLPKNVFHVCCTHFMMCSCCPSLNSQLTAPESREVKLNLSNWEPAVRTHISNARQENPPPATFLKLQVPFVILKRWKALSFPGECLGSGIRSQFYFQHCHWQAVWIWTSRLIS